MSPARPPEGVQHRSAKREGSTVAAAQNMLVASMQACSQRIDKLRLSVKKTRGLFPLTLERATTLTEDEEESVDALILRYSQCVSMIQDQLFRGIAYLEQEDISDKSNRDEALLMEKLGRFNLLTPLVQPPFFETSFRTTTRINPCCDWKGSTWSSTKADTSSAPSSR